MFANAVQRAAAHPLEGEEADEIRTDRLVLRKARPDDLDQLHAIFTDAETMAHWSTPPHKTLKESRDWLQSMIEGSGMARADYIIEKDGEVLGKVGPFKLPELGVLVRRDQWGQGIGFEAMSAIIAYLRERSFPYLVADIDPANKASVRLFEKLGFAQSGYKKNAMLYDGKPVDSVYMRKEL
nr:GNAT family N-acetyltransferase [Sphingomicrobium marinum]